MDDWSAFGFTTRWIFGKEKDGKHYFIIVDPDGSFTFKYKTNNLSSFNDYLLDKCSDFLTDHKGKEKVIVCDGTGNINIISRTTNFILPSFDIFKLDKISRSKESRDKYLSGLVDINFYEFENNSYFNVGLQGNGMNTAIPKASLLYKCEVLEGKNIIDFILETLSVTFVKYKSFTVLPYPFKYLNEFVVMDETNK